MRRPAVITRRLIAENAAVRIVRQFGGHAVQIAGDFNAFVVSQIIEAGALQSRHRTDGFGELGASADIHFGGKNARLGVQNPENLMREQIVCLPKQEAHDNGGGKKEECHRRRA